MKKILSSADITLLCFYKNLLDDSDIPAFIKNYYLLSGAGDIPPNECVPELWILNDDNLQKAKSLLITPLDSAWQCLCGEKISGQFAQCWKCGKIRSVS